MKKLVFTAASLLFAFIAFAQPYVITQKDKDRASEIVSKMTLDEKIAFISGKDDGFHTCAIPRLGIPSVRMADGPQGVRNNTCSTYYPCGIGLAASFNRDVAKGVGDGIGFDATSRGVRIMLCPGVNIYRSPLCGRNFEYYGEDPYLTSEIALNYIRGIQQHRVMATIKHFALNNQEYQRHRVSSVADERTMNEIYFPAFRKAVEQGNVAAVMTSYNPVNEVHAAENAWLIKDNLRAWGFDGIVMSDWKSTYTTLGVLTSGLDLEMPENYTTKAEMVKPLIENGVVPETSLDQMCRHILQSFIAYGLLDLPARDESIPEDYEHSRNMAYNAAVEAPVLLTNNGLLPLKKGRIVVLGPNANTVAYGGGSGSMNPIPGRNITPYAGLKALGGKYDVTLIEGSEFNHAERKSIAKADAVIVVAGFNHKTEYENHDRTYGLPGGQNKLIAAAASLNKNTVVIINSGGEVDITPFKDNVAAIIMAWYGGQEGGKALADIVSGKVSPSGKLPFTFWGSEEKNPAAKYYHEETAEIHRSSKSRPENPHTTYAEGIFVGYRGVEKYGIKPMFPFGFGLSYSRFEYSGGSVVATADGCEIVFTVSNAGKVDAMEVAQVYVAPQNPSVMRPACELKGFEKKFIGKGESAEFRIPLSYQDFSFYDVASHDWKVDPGIYKILIGSSSSDIRISLDYTVCQGRTGTDGVHSKASSGYVFTEASDLTLVGKIMDTANPYHRVDTLIYKGFTEHENFQVRCCAGLAVAFRTNSPSVHIRHSGNFSHKSSSTTGHASHGYDLYVRKNGKWVWAISRGADLDNPEKEISLIRNTGNSMKEYLLYLPIYSELSSLKIGVEEGCVLESVDSPFRHRVAVYGSSFTQGISISRAGMSYPAQFTRHTGIQMLPLGCSGNCKMQPYFADVLVDVQADAYVFDTFSNPNAETIKERLFPFIERLRAAHPGKPLIFQQTIRRENRNFSTHHESSQSRVQHVADSLMKIAVQRYSDVYYIRPESDDGSHEWSVDGIHPGDYGYYIWARSIEKPIIDILRKYGIE